MRQDRGTSLLGGLLSEHHVYVRSGPTSRYVVLTWPWRIGVTLAMVGIAVWVGLASFGWLAAHLETLEQRRELARLAQANQQLAALIAAQAEEGERAPPARLMTLVAELEDVKSGGQFGVDLSDAAAAEAGEVRRGPPPAGRLAERLLPVAMPADVSGSAREWLYDRIARQDAGDSRAAEAIRLRAELRAAQAEIARLENTLGAGRRDVIDP